MVFCEVKTRRGDRFGAPVEAVTVGKQRRLRVLATRWLSAHPGAHARDLRFDVASVLAPIDGPPTVEVVEGAF